MVSTAGCLMTRGFFSPNLLRKKNRLRGWLTPTMVLFHISITFQALLQHFQRIVGEGRRMECTAAKPCFEPKAMGIYGFLRLPESSWEQMEYYWTQPKKSTPNSRSNEIIDHRCLPRILSGSDRISAPLRAAVPRHHRYPKQ